MAPDSSLKPAAKGRLMALDSSLNAAAKGRPFDDAALQ
jgi:hypothetical protein